MALAVRPRSLRGKSKHSEWYERLLQETARQLGVMRLSGDLYVHIVWFQAKRERGDIDNMVKRILDALKGIIFNDDDQIVRCLSQKVVTSTPNLRIDVPSVPSRAVQIDLVAMLNTADNALYIEVGQVTTYAITFGPVV